MTPEDIRNVRFQPTRRFEKGYREHDVDRFLDHVADTLRQLRPAADTGEDTPSPEPTPELVSTWDVQTIAFSKPPIGLRGYNEDEVDAFLDRVEDTIGILEKRLAKYEQQ